MKGLFYISVIILGLFIDGLQATISAGLFLIGLMPGTVVGTAAGCAAGAAVAGKVGCAVAGFVFGVIGSFGNAAASGLVPIGIALGVAVSFCLSATLGTGLVFLLGMNGMFYKKYVFGAVAAEGLPFFSVLPGWTTMAVLSIVRHKTQSGKKLGLNVHTSLMEAENTPQRNSAATRPLTAANDNTPQTNAREVGSAFGPANDNTRPTRNASLNSTLRTKIDGIQKKAA